MKQSAAMMTSRSPAALCEQVSQGPRAMQLHDGVLPHAAGNVKQAIIGSDPV